MRRVFVRTPGSTLIKHPTQGIGRTPDGLRPITPVKYEELSPDEQAPTRLAGRSYTVAQIAEEVLHAVNNPELSPGNRAGMVYIHARRMMTELFRRPTAESVAQTKQVVGEIVNILLEDHDTAVYMLRMSMHDYDVYTHSINVGIFATCLAHRLYGLSGVHNIRELGAAFFLHDIGMARINANIVTKPSALSQREAAAVRMHPVYSYQIIDQVKEYSPECSIVSLQHHEREDGSGYPHGLRGNEIHDYARICSVADVFDALITRKPAVKPLHTYEALGIMRDEMMNHFHKEVFRGFVSLLGERAGVR